MEKLHHFMHFIALDTQTLKKKFNLFFKEKFLLIEINITKHKISEPELLKMYKDDARFKLIAYNKLQTIKKIFIYNDQNA